MFVAPKQYECILFKRCNPYQKRTNIGFDSLLKQIDFFIKKHQLDTIIKIKFWNS